MIEKHFLIPLTVREQTLNGRDIYTRLLDKSSSNDHVTNVTPRHVHVTTNRKEQRYVTGAQQRQVRNREIGFRQQSRLSAGVTRERETLRKKIV